jgi:hypothetical protein
MRIRTPQGKTVYIVVGYIGVVLLSILATVAIGGGVGLAGAAVAFAAFIGVGARLFRGDGEPVAPPRPWWRMTARPLAGFVLAALFGVQAVSSVVTSLVSPAGAPTGALTIVSVLAALAYLHSSVRLRAPAEPA